MSEVGGQPRPARRGVAIVLLALLAPQATLLLLRTEPSLDLLLQSATVPSGRGQRHLGLRPGGGRGRVGGGRAQP